MLQQCCLIFETPDPFIFSGHSDNEASLPFIAVITSRVLALQDGLLTTTAGEITSKRPAMIGVVFCENFCMTL